MRALLPAAQAARPAGAVGLAAAVWGLPAAPTRAQTAGRWPLTPGSLVYLDGQPSTAPATENLADGAISSVEGFSGPPGVARNFGDSTATRVLVLTTKANADSPAVLALADRGHLASAYSTRPITMREVAPAALAYITSHYPAYWLGGEVVELTRKSTGAVTYRVRLAGNWGFRYASFTAAGDFVAEGMW